MRVHHPCGCHDDESGGWAANDVQWKVKGYIYNCECECVCMFSSNCSVLQRNMENVYEQLLADFETASHKLQWSR